MAIVMEQGASAACVVVLLDDGDFKTCFSESGCCCDTSGSSTWKSVSENERSEIWNLGGVPTTIAVLGFSDLAMTIQTSL